MLLSCENPVRTAPSLAAVQFAARRTNHLYRLCCKLCNLMRVPHGPVSGW